MERNAWLLGYSPARWALGGITLLLLLPLVWLALKSSRDQPWLENLCRQVEERLFEKNRLGRWLALLLVAAILLFGAVAVFSFPAATVEEHLLRLPSFSVAADVQVILARLASTLASASYGAAAVVLRAWPLLLWMGLLAAQAVVVGGLLYFPLLRQRWATGWGQAAARAALIAIMISAAVFHWAVLLLRLKTFLAIRGWKWYFHDKPLGTETGLFALWAALVIGLSLLILTQPRAAGRNLLILLLLGYSGQVLFGSLEGQGFESLRLKYADSVFSAYAKAAAAEPELLRSLIEYETLYGQDGYLATKPPGLLLPYLAAQKITQLIWPAPTAALRFVHLTTFIAYTFPLLATLALAALFRLAQTLGEKDAMLPAFLLLVCPNWLLIPLFLDQALFPLLFLLALLVLLRALQQQSLWLAFLSGFLTYIAIYFSFSLLPLLLLAVSWVAIDYWIHRQTTGARQTLWLLIGIGLGLLTAYGLFRFTLNYDIFYRYDVALSRHRLIKEFQPGWQQIASAALLNNAEQSTWSGLPLIICFLAASAGTLMRFIRRRAVRRDGLLAAFWITYAGVNLLGQTIGEVQRLWLFMLPLITLYAAPQAAGLFQRKATGVILIVILQLITALLIFRFQDFYG